MEKDAWRVKGCLGGVSCVVAEWSGWGRCLKPCQLSHRVRQRHVLREPRNGGAPCPPLEERAGCVDDQRPQGAECQQSLIPALIATDSYGKERKKQGVPKEQETLGSCVERETQNLKQVPGSELSAQSLTRGSNSQP
ncbi:somatomedin-B and thrombospondin type-1 domain-containing protein isoform X1 [Prionailurus iriomotensis]